MLQHLRNAITRALGAKTSHSPEVERLEVRQSPNPILDSVLRKASDLIEESSMSDWIRSERRWIDKSNLWSGSTPQGFKAFLGGERIVVGYYPESICEGIPTHPPAPAICVGTFTFKGEKARNIVDQFISRVKSHQQKMTAKLDQFLADAKTALPISKAPYVSALEPLGFQGHAANCFYVEIGDIGLVMERTILGRGFGIEHSKHRVDATIDDGLVCVKRNIVAERMGHSFTSSITTALTGTSASLGFQRIRDIERLLTLTHVEMEVDESRILGLARPDGYYQHRGELMVELPAIKRKVLIQEDDILRGLIILRKRQDGGPNHDSAFWERYRGQSANEESEFLKKAGTLIKDPE